VIVAGADPGAEGAVAFLDSESGRVQPITVWLLGEPVPYARMRLSKTGAHFVPAPQRNFAAVLRIEAGNAMLHAHAPMFDEPLRMELLAEFGIPASWSKKKHGAAIRGEIRPGKRPDIDNLYKLVADSFNGIVYRDDALIVEVRARKIYGVQPKLLVTVQPAGMAPLCRARHEVFHTGRGMNENHHRERRGHQRLFTKPVL
jgi:Holliday junction resolvase RusA-like endonuclease